MGRAERRALARQQQKELAKVGNLSQDQKALHLFRNGITEDDVKKAYRDGWEAAMQKQNGMTQALIFAGVCMALHEHFGFGETRCFRVLSSAYDHILEELDTNEAIEKVWQQIGLKLQLDDPIEPIIFRERLLKPRKKAQK